MADTFKCVVQAWITQTVTITRIFEVEYFSDALTAMEEFMRTSFPTLTVVSQRAFSTAAPNRDGEHWEAPRYWERGLYPRELSCVVGQPGAPATIVDLPDL